MLKTGDRAPEFTLPDHTGQDRSLTDLLNVGALILYFYPADFTRGCTKEACAIRDMHAEIQRVGLRVAGVSPQDPTTHTKFRDKYQLPFLLLSDVDKAVIKMYDVDGPLGFMVRRATYLIDPARRVRASLLADFRIDKHQDFVRKAIMLRDATG
jgi:peroxiredoxin Q/BCP